MPSRRAWPWARSSMSMLSPGSWPGISPVPRVTGRTATACSIASSTTLSPSTSATRRSNQFITRITRKSKEILMPSFWDDNEIAKAAEGGKFIKFDDVGDTCTGLIVDLEKEEDPWKRLAIKVTFEDGRIANFAQYLM